MGRHGVALDALFPPEERIPDQDLCSHGSCTDATPAQQKNGFIKEWKITGLAQ